MQICITRNNVNLCKDFLVFFKSLPSLEESIEISLTELNNDAEAASLFLSDCK